MNMDKYEIVLSSVAAYFLERERVFVFAYNKEHAKQEAKKLFGIDDSDIYTVMLA